MHLITRSGELPHDCFDSDEGVIGEEDLEDNLSVKFWPENSGWCVSTLDHLLQTSGPIDSAAECWQKCESHFGGRLVAVDFWERGANNISDHACFCQDDCVCREDLDRPAELVTRENIEEKVECAPTPADLGVSVWEASTYNCNSRLGEPGTDQYSFFAGITESEVYCWQACSTNYSLNTLAIDFWPRTGECFCHDDCDCITDRPHR